MARRTWQCVMDQMQTHGKPATPAPLRAGHEVQAFDRIRNLNSSKPRRGFSGCSKAAKVSVATLPPAPAQPGLGLGWLPCRCWPRALAQAAIQNQARHHPGRTPAHPARRSRTPSASSSTNSCGTSAPPRATRPRSRAENMDWSTNTLSYFRKKTGELAQMAISRSLDGDPEAPAHAQGRSSRICRKRETAPGHRVPAAAASLKIRGRDAPQLSLRLGRAREDLRLPRTLRPGGSGPQQPRPCIAPTRRSAQVTDPVPGGVREESDRRIVRLPCRSRCRLLRPRPPAPTTGDSAARRAALPGGSSGCAFCCCQCWSTAFVTLTSQARSLAELQHLRRGEELDRRSAAGCPAA